ncbi:retrovirus-related pol polyprotein from transposon TNT 1-94 [Tanacetum coccineum]
MASQSSKRHRRDLSSDGIRDLATALGRGRLKKDLKSSTWRPRQDFNAQAKRLFGNKIVCVEMHNGIAWDKLENTNPQSTPQVLSSFEVYTPPVTYSKEVEETIGNSMEVELLDHTKLEDLGLNTCNHDIPLTNREVPSFDELKPQPQPFPNFPSLDVILGDKRGPEPPIKPHSPDSFRMKEVDHLTNHTSPSPHVASFQPKDIYCYYHPCVGDPKKHYGFKPGLLGQGGSLGVDLLNWEVIENNFLRGLSLPVKPNELENVIMEYLVNISKRSAFWSLNEDILKNIVLTTNTSYPSRKIRRICACTHQRPRRKHDQYAQYKSKTRADYGSVVARPKIEDNDKFELKGQFLKELRTNTFIGSDHEDANEHIEKVLEIVDLFHIPNITINQVMLRAFPMSLTGAASRWLRNEPSDSITNWDGLKTKFLNKYCPTARTVKKMEEINKFQQEPDENLYQAWEQFKELLMKCSQHYLTKMQEVILFYNGLGIPTRQILDSRGAIPSKIAANAKVAIQEMAEYSQKWHNRTSRSRSTKTSDRLAAIQAQLNNFGREIKKVNEKVYAAQVGC